jgi:structural maintenance of chromosomes protein 5
VGGCSSFLPQDKVSEFAAMSPSDLLKETQRAAGDKNLTKWHQTLVESGKGLRKLQEVRYTLFISS